MTITTRLYTWLSGEFVGVDEFGNRYFTEKNPSKNGRAKRWVLYNGRAEPSKVPPRWHGWLHYSSDDIPNSDGKKYTWEKPHLPNLTGIKNAYAPDGSLLGAAVHARTTAEYEAWVPE